MSGNEPVAASPSSIEVSEAAMNVDRSVQLSQRRRIREILLIVVTSELPLRRSDRRW